MATSQPCRSQGLGIMLCVPGADWSLGFKPFGVAKADVPDGEMPCSQQQEQQQQQWQHHPSSFPLMFRSSFPMCAQQASSMTVPIMPGMLAC